MKQPAPATSGTTTTNTKDLYHHQRSTVPHVSRVISLVGFLFFFLSGWEIWERDRGRGWRQEKYHLHWLCSLPWPSLLGSNFAVCVLKNTTHHHYHHYHPLHRGGHVQIMRSSGTLALRRPRHHHHRYYFYSTFLLRVCLVPSPGAVFWTDGWLKEEQSYPPFLSF
ncbi:uncharacterized protein J3D65DRAFT_326981 [Phyllosticta citribraziliensis]|uniref:Uncharacterized protein n=1 Tax=Phyllosticta citribraziliensis TaxID=989973 RepID=A0ABR1LTB7_9PEZI